MSNHSGGAPLKTQEFLQKKWNFLRLLGEGANGKTYLAEHKTTGERAAIKVMKFALAENFKSHELFCREAEVLKSLHVRGVPTVYECQVGDATHPGYIIQEYIDAPTLQALVQEHGPFSEERTITILQGLARIIYALQTQYVPPVIHRDIKPSNVLCDLSGTEPIVTLIDFGAVANPQKRSGGSTVAGTFGYMAPEQMLNDVVLQSDYYSIGALAIYLLTGKEPYQLQTVGHVFEIDYKTALEINAPETSLNMVQLIGHLVHPVAAKRPENADALLRELERVAQGKCPLPDAKPSLWKRIRHGISAFLSKHLFRSSVRISPKKWSKWLSTKGVIRFVKVQNGIKRMEYTFDVDGRTWCGVVHASPSTKIVPPCPCIVRYDPNDPRFNYAFAESTITENA